MPELTPEIERELAAIDDALAGRRVESELTELGELALALRDERPRPGPAFGAELDAKVERGFRDPGPRGASGHWWEGLLTVPAFGLGFAVLLVAVVIVAGPSGSDDEDEAGGGAPAAQSESFEGGGGFSPSSAEEGGGGARAAQEPAAAADDAVSSLAPVPPAPGTTRADGRERRSIERSASLTLAARPRDVDAVSARIQEVTRAQGGFVVSSTVSSSTDGGGGQFELRIPTRNLDAAMAALSRLGSVRERAQRTQDITAERVSVRSRLKDARTERSSLLRQLADAVTVAETESIRRRLDIVSREIEAARADVRRINNRTAFSTVIVSLISDRGAAVPGGGEDDSWSPGDAARDALRVLEVAAGVALIALAIVLPLALLAVPAVLAARWSRRRRREHALDAV